MGEGTQVFDAQKEIAELKRRLDLLEFQRTSPISPPLYQQVPPQGCVCPVGAQFNCGNTGCPRRRFNPGGINY